MTDVKFNSNNSLRRVSPTPSMLHSQQQYSTNHSAAIRDFEFSTSSTHNIADAGAYLDLYEASYDNVSTSAILHYCKLKVLKPYFRLHSLLGWRPMFLQATLFENNCWIQGINMAYTTMILAFVVLGYVLQHASCYRQDGFPHYREYKAEPDTPTKVRRAQAFMQIFNKSGSMAETAAVVSNRNGSFDHVDEMNGTLTFHTLIDDQTQETVYTNATMVVSYLHDNMSRTFSNNRVVTSDMSKLNATLTCRGNFFAMYLIPDVLHFFAYLFILYLMRTPESERLENLMERGFLQTSRTTGWFLAHRKLVNALRCFLWICVGWLLVSLTIHGLEVGTRLFEKRLDFTWIHPSAPMKIVLVCLTICTLTSNDLICGAIVTSYAVHCQLNISYIINLCASIRERRLEFNEFYKRVEESRKFIDYLNSDQALGISLLQVNIGCKLVVALYALLASSEVKNWTPNTLAVVLLSVFFWLSLFAVPLIQGVRLTAACRELQKIGHELRSRPFGYQEAQQQDLDSLLLYTTTLTMEAKILHVPIRSSCLVIVCVFALIAILMLGQLGILNV